MKYTFPILLIFLSSLIFGQGNLVAHWDFNTEGDNIANEIINNNDFAVTSIRNSVEQLDAVLEKGFRTDGYSTWAEGFLNNTTLPTSEFTLATWVAIESYSINTAAIFANYSQSTFQGVILGMNKYGQLQIKVNTGGLFTTVISDKSVPLYQWNHIVMSVNTTDKRMMVYVNGEVYVNQGLYTGNVNWAIGSRTYIMRDSEVTTFADHNTNVVNGIIDDIKIYDKSWTANEVTTAFENQKPSSLMTTVPISKNRFEGDVNRPKYHAIPRANWCNEPYGLVYHNNQYHFFYQKQAAGSYLNQMNWGHQVSDDLVNWTDKEMVLLPTKNTFDGAGCWSGTCVIADDGTPTLIYTGVDGTKAGIGVADGNAVMTEFSKSENNPVVPQNPLVGLMDFRDPFVWKEGNGWYMIIGAGEGNGSGGTILLFKSADLTTWTYVRKMYIGNEAIDDAGEHWEMPAYHNFGNKSILLVNRTPQQGKRAKAMYFIGELTDTDFFFPDDVIPTDLDIINTILAPSISTDADGNVIALGILPDEISGHIQRQQGWANFFSLPRVLTFSESENRILQKPHPNLVTLRESLTEFSNVAMTASSSNFLGETRGRQLEIEATFDSGTAREVGLVIGKSDNGDELTQIFYNTQTGYFIVNRAISSLETFVPKSTQAGLFPLPNGEPFTMRVFIDGSAVEVFINDKYAFATRIFPTKGDRIDLHVKSGEATATSVKIWTMKAMKNSEEFVIVQKNDNLDLQIIENVYPNPFSNSIIFQYNLESEATVTWLIVDSVGRKVADIHKGNLSAGTHTTLWNGGNSNQLYYATIFIDGKPKETLQILKQP